MATVKWTPAVKLDLGNASQKAMTSVIDQFHEHFKGKPLEPHGLKDGWHQIEPQKAETLLRLNPPGANRKVSVTTVRYYGKQMEEVQWQRTGQSILISDKNILLDSQHRLWAGYLTSCAFPSYVITSIPHIDNIFAYIDNGKARSPTDALYTAGLDGYANRVAAAVKIAYGYDNGCYSVEDETKVPKLTPIHVLEYVMANPKLPEAAHLQLSQYEAATDLFGSKCKDLAVFVAWKIAETYGEDMLDQFMSLLGDEDCEDHTIVLLRKRLLSDASAEKQMRKSLKLGYVTKVFNAWRLQQPMSRLQLSTIEPWPQFADLQVEAEAA